MPMFTKTIRCDTEQQLEEVQSELRLQGTALQDTRLLLTQAKQSLEAASKSSKTDLEAAE